MASLNLTDPRQKKAPRKPAQTGRAKSDATFYNSPIWRRVSAQHRAKHPMCAHCALSGKLTPATETDHVRPIRLGGASLDQANLQSLCTSCHAKKSAKEKHVS